MINNLDKNIDSFVKPFSDGVTNFIFTSLDVYQNSLPLVVVWLVVASVFFTFYFKFINIRAFKRAFSVALGKYDKPNAPGEITHFQSFTAAMSRNS